MREDQAVVRRRCGHMQKSADRLFAGRSIEQKADFRFGHADADEGARATLSYYPRNRFLAMKNTLAGRSARRRMK